MLFLQARYLLKFGACLCIAMMFFCDSDAQSPINPNLTIDLIDPARELEDRLKAEKLEDDIRRFRSTDEIKPTIANPESANEGPCVNVYDIHVEGVTILSADYIQALLKGRFPGCLRRFHISDLMRNLDKAYVDQGYITARTYIPQQDIRTTGVLRLVVVEGLVEEVSIIKNGIRLKGGDLERITAFPNLKGKHLNIRDFEQGLEQLNRQSSVKAKMRLEPGKEPGGSIVNIDAAVEDRFRGYIGFDNLGSRSTGERELRIQLGADGLLSANDVGSLVYVGSTNANAINGALSIPLGYNTLTGSASISDYLLPLSDITELFSRTESYSLSLDRVLNRDARSISNLSAALRYRESERFINGIALTPKNTTVLDVRFRHIANYETARWSYEMGLRSGLPWFGGDTDYGSLSSDIPHAEFQAIDFSITRIGKGRKQGQWTTRLRGQIAAHALLGSEQFSLGSQSTVRGFREPVLGGDSGASLRHEGRMPLPKLTMLKEKLPGSAVKVYGALKQKSEFYVFADIGAAYSFGFEEARLATGAGAGYRFFSKKTQFDLGVQSGLVDYTTGSLRSGDTRLTMSMTYKAF